MISIKLGLTVLLWSCLVTTTVLGQSGVGSVPGGGAALSQDEATIYLEQLLQDRKEKDQSYRTKGEAPFKSEKDRKRFDGIQFFEGDVRWIVPAYLAKVEEPDTLLFATSAGTVKSYLRYAELRLHFPEGQLDTLTAYRSQQWLEHPVYGKQLFVPFTDENSGERCYGGGRYLDITLEEENGWIEVDFNRAYNPYCAYSDGWFCPIPPRENHLGLPVDAGEQVSSTETRNH